MLICSACREEKKESCFWKDGYSKRGFVYKCKECSKNNRKSSKPPVLKDNKKFCSSCKTYKNFSKFSKSTSQKSGYRPHCKQCESKRYHSIKNTENYKNTYKKYRDENKEKINNKNRKYYYKNKEKVLNQRKKRLKEDPLHRFSISVRKSIAYSFRRAVNGSIVKRTKSLDILGCSMEFFIKYIEDKFEEWMNWENRGLYNGKEKYGWDLDHIIPLHTAKTEEDVIKLNHYTNFQPLCSKINRDVKWRNYK